MADPMVDQLDSDFDCEHLLSCFHDLTALDRECFRVLVESEEPLSVDELTERLDRERSTVYRSVGRLVDAGIVQEFQRNYDQGGYYHVYRLADPDALADEFQGILNDWYAKMGGLIDEFRDEYAD
jgi:predicted transcriptional regulator